MLISLTVKATAIFLVFFGLVAGLLIPAFVSAQPIPLPPAAPPNPGGGSTQTSSGASPPSQNAGQTSSGNPLPSSDAEFTNPLDADSLMEFLDIALDALILILFPFVVLFFIYGAFNLIRAQGNQQMLTSGKRALLWTTVGALIILGARALTIAISNTVEEIRQATVSAPTAPIAHLSTYDDEG